MTRYLRLLPALVGGILACGLPLWWIPYSQVSIGSNPAPGTWLILGAVCGCGGSWMARERFWPPVGAVTLGYAIAVYGRVSVETSRDPTSHNLWPFEVVIACAIGFAGALIGAGLVRFFRPRG